jgi:hypothetical protein
MTPQEFLNANGIYLKSYAPGRYYTTCPQCSRDRHGAAHQRAKVFGVTIEGDSVHWGCNHCGWTGPEKGTGKSNGHDRGFAATYDYCDAGGILRFQKVRNPPGSNVPFWMRRPDGNGGWIKDTKGVDTNLLYRLPEVSEAIALGHTILVVEGEKDADNLWRINIPATCNAHGASKPDQKPKWRIEHSEQLRGADIIVMPDHDPQGYAHAEATCSLSTGITKRVRRLDLAKHWPECPEGGDVSDWLAAGHTREELDALIGRAPDYAKQEPPPSPSSDGWQFHDEKPSPLTQALIKNLLPETGAGLLSGQWGTFKTTTALDLAISVMSGVKFAGRFIVKRQGGVAYFAVEGSGGLKSRLNALAQERGVKGVLPFAWRADCPSLTAKDALAQLVRMAKEAEQELRRRFNIPLVLIYIDTMIAAAGYANTGDDNDTAAAQKIMSVLSGLSRQTGALVLGVDHFGKDVNVGTRGNSVKEGHADVVLALLGDRQPNGTITNMRLAVRKQRDGISGLEIPFTPRDVVIGIDEDKDPVTRKVLDWDKHAATGTADNPGWSKSLQLLRRILMKMLAEAGTDVSDVMPFAGSPVVRAVDLKLIRTEFYKQYPADGDDKQKAEARRKTFGRVIRDAQARSLIMVREIGDAQLVWLVAKTEEQAA